MSPELSQVSSEEPAEEVAMVEEEAEEVEASQEAMPIVQETPIVPEDHSPDQAPLISSDRPPSLLEEASDTQSDTLLPPSTSPVPFPVTNEPEDQGYGTQDDEDRVAHAESRAPGKHVHWGGVEAQAAYTRPQEDEEHTEEQPSPPFSRLLLPGRCQLSHHGFARRVASSSRALHRSGPPLGLSLDLSGADNRSLIAFGSHGWENQQWEFQSCGAGFVIKSVATGMFLAIEDLQGLHRDGSTEVVTGQFPMCWEMEIMDNGSADEEDGDGDVYARIRLPHTEMALSFNGGHAGAQLFLTRDANNTSTYWRLRAPRRWNDDFDNDHERDEYDDENYDTNCYGRRMKAPPPLTGMRTHHDRDEQLFHIIMHPYILIFLKNFV
ncbi:hypothetical protein EI94DRAFT_1802336 [Lactarius quietus]|nr:hypothetical protein EI94DRAFT_1802336 [Lactarius quietus]